MRNNKKWFTLIEIVVVIVISSILIWILSSFFNWLKKSSEHREIVSEIDEFNNLFNKLKITDLYLSDYYNTEKYKSLNSMSKDKLTDIYYAVYIIKPVIVNKLDKKPLNLADIWNGINDYRDLTIWLQSCGFLFDLQGKTINWKNYEINCDDPYIWNWKINLQWFLIWNNIDLITESDKYLFNTNNYFWYNYNIYNESNTIIENWKKTSYIDILGYKYYNLLNDNISDFYLNNFFVFKLRKLNWEIDQKIYYWTENDFTNIIKNKYIPWVLNNTLLDTSDITKDLDDRIDLSIWQYNSVQFLYHNPSDFTIWYKEILPLWFFNKNE